MRDLKFYANIDICFVVGSQIGFRSQSAVKCREDPSRKYTTYVSFDERRVEVSIIHLSQN